MGWLRSGSDHEVVLLSKPGCHLCDAARAVIEAVCAELEVPWSERNILDDDDLMQQYAEMIPVTLVDGKQHDYFRVDERRLRRALLAR
ncbi:glutaredoxin family protein [Demetria terragena]|uniref:glutaredoxin family protein n=1 Tax=Demetria terragena TaxID=63959 RepID=UPI00036C58FD|nr:glutaredoxin family protein [Demetria terragena]